MTRQDEREERRQKVWELHRQGLNEKEIVEALKDAYGCHWRTVQNDIHFMQTTVAKDAPNWLKDAQSIGRSAIDDLEYLRDLIYPMLDDPDTKQRTQLMKLLAEISIKLFDMVIPAQARVTQTEDRKWELSWPAIDPNVPICEKCGKKHYPSQPCIIDIYGDLIANPNPLLPPQGTAGDS